MSKILALALAFLCLSLSVHAAGLIAHSPEDNVTIDPERDGFTFSTEHEYRDTILASCSLYIDGAVSKRLVINDKLGGQSRRYSAQLGEGSYEWRITCDTEDGETISTGVRTVHVVTVLSSPVTVTSSGITRGSLLHGFAMQNTADQPPVEVPDVRPGDVIEITINIPPSSLKRELFVKGRYSQNGADYVRLSEKTESIEIYKGENVTIDIKGINIICQFNGIENNNLMFTFYPSVVREEPEEPAEETSPEEEQVEPEPVPEEPEPTIPEESVPEIPEAPETPAPPEQPVQQSFFTRLLSFLARIFGT